MKPSPSHSPSPAPAVSASSGDSFIQLRGVEKAFGTQRVLRGLDLDIYRGETLVLIGPSGEGKSVLLKHIIGLLRPDAGSVCFDGTLLEDLDERQLRPVRRRIGYLFQNAALFDSLSVADNVAFPLREARVKNEDEIQQRVQEALEIVELGEHAAKMPINLSGGMRKRVGIARAIVDQPEILLYDEPTAGLDPIVTDVIDHMIRRMKKRFGITSVVITHDMGSVFKVADRIAMLMKGVIYFEGTPKELRSSRDPLLRNFITGRSEMTMRSGWGDRAPAHDNPIHPD
ncbi:MAG: ABC transporter ATP-binding protein [Verrucomicrobiales bacterium]|nr:ABC transporter ATP-binding protein [Verrucomicrobiales bacterium]